MTIAERTEEMTDEVREALRAYPGKWVAMTQHPTAILAVGNTPTEVYEAAHRAGVETPLLYQVPDNKVRAYYY